MNFKRLLFLWLIMVMFSGGALAQMYTDHIVRNFELSGKSSIEIYNKYGKVHIITWDKDSVKFEIDLRIVATNTEKLGKLKNQISFDFTNTNYYIIARTRFERPGGVFANLASTIVPLNDISINYTVYLPATATLKVENKYGDVFIDDHLGNLDLSVSNGNLKANYLKGNSFVELKYADSEINKIDNGTLEISYCDFEIEEAGKLKLITKRSKLKINRANKLSISSRQDRYDINETDELTGQGDFTKLNIGKLNKEISFSNKYYGVVIEEINMKFRLVNLVSDYTDINLGFPAGSSYNLDINHHKDVQLLYPSNIKTIETQVLNEEENLMMTYGLIGAKATSNSPKVKIVANKKCYISIIHR